MEVVEIIAICMPIFIVILIGNMLLRSKLIDHAFINSSNKLVMNVFLPALLFYEITKSNFNEVFSYKHVIITLGAILIMFLISFPLGNLLKLSKATNRTFISNNFRANCTFIGLPVAFYAFGAQGLAIASIYLAFMVPLNNILGIMVYNTGGFKIADIKAMIRSTFFNPLIIACFLGIIFAMLDISLPAFINKTFSILSGVALPLALIGIGVNINIDHINGNKTIIAISSIMKLVFLPLIAFVIFKLFGIENFGLLERVAIILLASPSAQVNYIFASAMDGDPDLASGGIIFSTILSALSLVAWISIMR
jgi:hypothetical protein